MPESAARPPVLIVEDLGQQRLPARRMAAGLERAGWPVLLAGFCGAGDEAGILEIAARHAPALVVVSQLFAHLLPGHLEMLTTLRGSGCRAHLTLAGDLPGMAAAELLAGCPALDSVLVGGHEHALPLLAAAVEGEASWNGVPGLSRRGSPLPNPPSPAPNLDSLPWPAYPAGLPSWGGVSFCTVEASRGCWHDCAFCLPCAVGRRAGQPYQMRSMAGLGDEIEARYRAGARLFLFDDEQFLPPAPARAARVDGFGRELEGRGLRIAFTLKCRPDEVDPDLFRQLKEAGLLRVYLGVESNSPGVLFRLGKGFGAAANRRALAVLDDLGIVADFRVLLFHPWSTAETIATEIEALGGLLDLVPSCLSFREVEVYPGTRLARDLAIEGRPVAALDPLGYRIPDAGAEWLRRMQRPVFEGCGPYRRPCDHLTLDWFSALLADRGLIPGGGPDRRAVQAAARAANEAALEVWASLLGAVARGGPPGTVAGRDLAEKLSGELARLCAGGARLARG